jgi:hypothetical protein
MASALIFSLNFSLNNVSKSPSIRRKEGDDQENLLVSTKQVNGCNDDILDILVVPPNPEDSLDIITDSNTISQGIVERSFCLHY